MGCRFCFMIIDIEELVFDFNSCRIPFASDVSALKKQVINKY